MSDSDKIDDYELVNCIATGSATQIWEVKKSGNTQPLAMKLLLEEAFKDGEAKRALKHEANVGKTLEHPAIIKIHELKMTRKVGYFIMEYFRAGNLKTMIRNDRPLAQARCKKLMEAISQALAFVHEKGWIHRDIKPENILLNKGGEVRLIDFSLSSKPSNAIARALTKKKNIVIQGTRTYLAPELIRRDAMTHSVDMYSLGVTLYEILVGNPPFRTANPNDLLLMHVRDKPVRPSEFDDNITSDVDDLVMRMLAKTPKDRPSSMTELFTAVRSMKFFKEDPIEVNRARAEAAALSDAQANEDRLNSRRDAERDKSKDAERKPAPKPKPKPVIAPVEKKPEPQPGQQPMPGYPPQPGMPMPGYPGMMPGQMPPGYPMYPGMMPGFPQQPGVPVTGYPGMMPGQMPPGFPQPGMPGVPPPGMPPQQPPGQSPAVPGQGGGVAPGQPTPPQPSVPQPAPPQPAAPQPAPPQGAEKEKKSSTEDIPLATFDDLEIE